LIVLVVDREVEADRGGGGLRWRWVEAEVDIGGGV
jgi:hypothetical protein